MAAFDVALEKRFAENDEIAAIDIASGDTLLIRDASTGLVMRLPFSTLTAAISSAFGSSFASLIDGKVPASQLPSYVDDVLEYADFAALPGTGESGKIYVTLDTNLTYRWSGSAYVEISASLALGETSATAYRGDRGKTAYDHSQLTSGNPHGTTKSDVGLSNVDNTSDANKPVSTAQQTALDLKLDKTKGYSNVWTPTLTNVGNVDSSTAFECFYARIGDLCVFGGTVAINATAATDTVLGMSLPIASDFTAQTDAGGTYCSIDSGIKENGAIYADATNNRLSFQHLAADVSTNTYKFSGCYLIK